MALVEFNPLKGKFDIKPRPAGSDTQMQYNNGGLFGGTTGLTWDGNLHFTNNTGAYFGNSDDAYIRWSSTSNALKIDGATLFSTGSVTIDNGGLTNNSLNINGSTHTTLRSTATDEFQLIHGGYTYFDIDSLGSMNLNSDTYLSDGYALYFSANSSIYYDVDTWVFSGKNVHSVILNGGGSGFTYTDAAQWIQVQPQTTGNLRQIGLHLDMYSGYTGSNYIRGLEFDIQAKTTDVVWYNDAVTYGYRPGGASGIGGFVRGSGAINVGAMLIASQGSVTSIGAFTGATVSKGGATNIGLLSSAYNTVGYPIAVYGVLRNTNSAPPLTRSGAGVFDNDMLTSIDILVARRANTDVWEINKDGDEIAKNKIILHNKIDIAKYQAMRS